jgi:hypothetical protein
VNEAFKTVLFGHDMGLMSHSVWEDHVYLLGSSESKDDGRRVYIPKGFLTLYSQAHQVSWYLLPLQMPLVYFAYPTALKAVSNSRFSTLLAQAEKSKRLFQTRQAQVAPKGNFDII